MSKRYVATLTVRISGVANDGEETAEDFAEAAQAELEDMVDHSDFDLEDVRLVEVSELDAQARVNETD